MKRIKNTIKQMLPVILVIAVTASLSILIYDDMIDKETENSWQGLHTATNDIAREIAIRFEDNFTMLDLAANAMLMEADLNNSESVISYLNSVREKTLFERIDILLPDETLISQVGGTDKRPPDRRSYSELLQAGPHLSTRVTDIYTNNETIFYFTPVVADGKAQAILIGALSCDILGDIFTSTHYNGASQIFVIDQRDGSFIVDKWHPKYGNIRDMHDRELTEDFEGTDFINDITKGETGEVALISKLNQKTSFMSYMPVSDYPLSVALFVQDEVIFKDVTALRDLFTAAGIIELLILLIYLIWNMYIVSVAVENRERAMRAELENDKNAAKTQFLSSVSHDIRTPLNGIIGMLNVIRLKENVPDNIADPLHKIDISAKYLLTLANDVLDLNELESGKLIIAKEPVDLKELIEDVFIIMQPRAKEAGITLHTNTEGLKNPRVLGSAVHISKILMNLISNAIKYNKENGKIWISAENDWVTNGQSTYLFSIKDTGVGMTEEFQKNMFNAFEQENAGARTKQTGHGLGLSIVKQLIDKMDGTIDVKSKKGEGSTFYVTLPLPININQSVEDSDSDYTNLQGTKILLVEDNELNMEIANILLTETGAIVTQAYNGEAAVDKFKHSEPYSFDVILMDIMMPVMDGIEATKTIRTLDRPDAKRIPIIAMTASTFSEDIQRCRDAGMDEHISKPLDIGSVINKIAKLSRKFRSTKKLK